MFIEQESDSWKRISEVVSDEGFQVYDLEKIGGSGLRVVISASPGKESSQAAEGEVKQGAVTSSDCSRVCKRLLLFLAVEGPALGFSSEPQMEVCSPGVNRNLRNQKHFENAVGERVRVVCRSLPGDGSESGATPEIVGTLEEFIGDSLKVRDESSNELVSLKLSNVKKARVDFHFGQ